MRHSDWLQRRLEADVASLGLPAGPASAADEEPATAAAD